MPVQFFLSEINLYLVLQLQLLLANLGDTFLSDTEVFMVKQNL